MVGYSLSPSASNSQHFTALGDSLVLCRFTAERGFEGLGGLEGFLALPGIAQTPAGQAGRVLVYEDLYLLGLGPRTGQLAAQLVRALPPELAE